MPEVAAEVDSSVQSCGDHDCGGDTRASCGDCHSIVCESPHGNAEDPLHREHEGDIPRLAFVRDRDALLGEGYIRKQKTFECPVSQAADYDDYRLVYNGDNLISAVCTLMPGDHILP